MRSIFFVLIFLMIFVVSFFPQRQEMVYEALDEKKVVQKISDPVSILFVGDIMLGRDVESYMMKNGAQYPFQSILPLLLEPDLTIGNFEGTVTPVHIVTPNMAMQFSIREEYLIELSRVGFDILSLANNHSYDYGEVGYTHTKSVCENIGLICLGSAITNDGLSMYVYEEKETRVGFIFIHATWHMPDDAVMKAQIEVLASKSDIQIAYIHWGNEYDVYHSSDQERFAQMLVDTGVDAIIGHHPHVIQDVALYKGKPIFYSLGNCIFDQYFSRDVQEGLGIMVKIDEEKIQYSLIPMTSEGSRNQPQIMDLENKERIRKRILATIEQQDTVEILQDTITVIR